MQFILSSSELLENLLPLKSVILNKNTNPILDNFLFDIGKEYLDVTASSGDIYMRARLPIEMEEEGMYAVPADKLVDILRNLPDQPLTFSFDDTHLRITAEHGKYTLPLYPGEDFPQPKELEEPFERSISGSQLADAMDKTLLSVMKEETYPILQGVLFHFMPDRLNMVSTDRRRLAVFGITGIRGEDERFVIPARTAQLLRNLAPDEEVLMQFTENTAGFRFGNFYLLSTLLKGKFPEYALVIPKDNPFEMIANRERLLQALKRISIFASKQSHLIKMNFSGSQLTLYTRNEEISSDAEEKMTVNYQGEDFSIGFHVKFLIEMLSHLDSEDIRMTFSDPKFPSLIYPLDGLADNEEVLMLLMPLSE